MRRIYFKSLYEWFKTVFVPTQKNKGITYEVTNEYKKLNICIVYMMIKRMEQ